MTSALAERIRELLGERDVREVHMFGALSFLVNGRIAVAVRQGGDLLVRIDPADREALLSLPGAHPATMGAAQRRMGAGWITVDAAELHGNALETWIEQGMRAPG